ncbi:metal ABC transporter substrate-binding protein [Desulfothermobacter acidiphilus]|uniref:metal ABC transporter substrate-binding protein n=1 Tax=Desulfothermobacter acidiphilus TaxID=1938353 RepID=UPI003F8B1D20
MKKQRILVPAVVLLALTLLLAGCGTKAQKESRLNVATGSTLIASIVEEIGKDRVAVTNIVPPGVCPGHFDLKPGDVQKLSTAQLLLYHDWEGKLFSENLLKSVHNDKLVAVPIAVQGNWMAPPMQKQAIEAISAALCQHDPSNQAFYQENARKALAEVEAKEKELRAKLQAANVSQVKILCAEMQQGFLKWAGFQIVGTYGRPEDLTPQKLQELLRKGREEGVKLVVDNLQSGPDAGKGLAEELKVPHVVLSNFPGAWPGTDTWSAAVTKNVDLLLEALKKS